jgi:aspartate/glutamate racemase
MVLYTILLKKNACKIKLNSIIDNTIEDIPYYLKKPMVLYTILLKQNACKIKLNSIIDNTIEDILNIKI